METKIITQYQKDSGNESVTFSKMTNGEFLIEWYKGLNKESSFSVREDTKNLIIKDLQNRGFKKV